MSDNSEYTTEKLIHDLVECNGSIIGKWSKFPKMIDSFEKEVRANTIKEIEDNFDKICECSFNFGSKYKSTLYYFKKYLKELLKVEE